MSETWGAALTAKMLFGFFVGVFFAGNEDMTVVEAMPISSFGMISSMFFFGSIGALIGAALHLRAWRIFVAFGMGSKDDSEEE